MIALLALVAFVSTIVYIGCAFAVHLDARSDWRLNKEYLNLSLQELKTKYKYRDPEDLVECAAKALEAAYRMNNFWGAPFIALRKAQATKREALRVAREHDSKEGHAD